MALVKFTPARRSIIGWGKGTRSHSFWTIEARWSDGGSLQIHRRTLAEIRAYVKELRADARVNRPLG